MKYYRVLWTDLHTNVFKLAKKIISSNYQADLIIAIARGGLTISHILSDFLRLPITSFTISSYHDLKQHKIPEVILHLGNKLNDKKILLVDDVSDTGKTFTHGIRYLQSLGAKDIKTVSVYTKPWTKFYPDFHVKEVSDWIVFPYDMRETVEGICRNLEKEGKNLKEIKKTLKKIKIPGRYLNSFINSK